MAFRTFSKNPARFRFLRRQSVSNLDVSLESRICGDFREIADFCSLIRKIVNPRLPLFILECDNVKLIDRTYALCERSPFNRA